MTRAYSELQAASELQSLDARIAEIKQGLPAPAAPPPDNTMPGWWSTTEAMTMSASVLVFGSFVICVAALLVKRGKTAESVLRMFGTILIIVAALFLVVAGYSDQQVAPVMGLLGTIAGYLLGKDSGEGGTRRKEPSDPA
ncbi:hypothetical protein OOT46_07670 [Aquabacterium sp. A7-Y]|uniref:hypothetical protein n=1 Tax=Aquabacterium sp. A7-Y TaxID=1349605 RepID=UPI00223CA5AD|nr:hypothetical protein [Aquabacterium sp. A7-Y]MCW7537727.1 hypothetical protein [Aquabacterium sp. A7-Y]